MNEQVKLGKIYRRKTNSIYSGDVYHIVPVEKEPPYQRERKTRYKIFIIEEGMMQDFMSDIYLLRNYELVEGTMYE